MTKTQILRLSGISTVALLALAPAAHADSPSELSPPENVSSWFSEEAPGIVRELLIDNAVNIPLGNEYSQEGVFQLGAPEKLFAWNDDAMRDAGNVSAEDIVEPTDQWVAALYQDDRVVGKVIATVLPDGALMLDSVDDDHIAGMALDRSDSVQYLVEDPQLGGLIEITEEGEASGLSQTASEVFEDVYSVEEIQATVTEIREADAAWENEAGSQAHRYASDASPMRLFGAICAVLLLVSGVLVVLSSRSTISQ